MELIYRFLPIKARISRKFFIQHSYKMDWDSPSTFNHYIQQRKLSISALETRLADKYAVRSYVEALIGEQYLIPLQAAYDSVDEIKFDLSAKDIVIKTNHGSGIRHLEVFPTKLNLQAITKKFKIALKEKYEGIFFGEFQYKNITPKLLVEKKIGNESVPEDYKFHIFKKDGQVKWTLQIDFDRFTEHKRNYYDMNLELLPLSVIFKNGNFALPDACKVYEMADLAIKLADKFRYVRVDLYLVDNKIYFGEMTFTPGNGFEAFSDQNFDKLWGSYIY